MFARQHRARRLPCEGQAEEPDGARGNNTVAKATAPRHSDAVNHRVVAHSVEYRIAHRGVALGSLTPGHPPCAARCKASFSAWSSFRENRVGPPLEPEAPAQASGPEHAA
jgi:hypothetical protein